MRDTDYIAAKLLDLDNLKGHAAIEHEGWIHVRYRRRVIFVYNVDEDTFRVNDLQTKVEMQAANRCLKIVDVDRRVAPLKNEDGLASDGKRIKARVTPVWEIPMKYTAVLSAFTPREEFSAITGVSLSTAAGRAAHEEARDVS